MQQKEKKRKEKERKKLEEEDPKEARKRRLEDALEGYNQLLKEVVTDPDVPWEEAVLLLEKDPRYRHDAIFPDKKEKLFKTHRHFLFMERREQKKQGNKPKYEKPKE